MQKKCDIELYQRIKAPEIKEGGKIGKYYHGHLYLNPNQGEPKPSVVTIEKPIQSPTIEQASTEEVDFPIIEPSKRRSKRLMRNIKDL